MSLVAYENSDSSSSSSDNEENSSNRGISESKPKSTLFSLLPPPKSSKNEQSLDTLKETVVRNEKKPVKIVLPMLSQIDDDEEEESAPKKPKLGKGSGLFSVLPPPKNVMETKVFNRSLIPHTLSKPASKPAVSSKPKSKSSVSSKSGTPVNARNCTEDSDEENEIEGADFFSLNSTSSSNIENSSKQLKSEESNLTSSENSTFTTSSEFWTNKDTSIPSQVGYSGSSQSTSVVESSLPDMTSEIIEPEALPSSSSEDNVVSFLESEQQNMNDVSSLLKNEAFLRMQGKKRVQKGIEIIDVSLDDQLPNREEWLTKSITDEYNYTPRKKGGFPTSQQRRKHQITYLAFQAKERELELKNQWAENRMTRKQTQSKYGF